MTTFRAVAALSGAAALALTIAAPAQAADYRETYASAVDRSIVRSDIPSSLGSFKAAPQTMLMRSQGSLFVCPGPQSVPDGISAAGPKYTWTTTFVPKDERSGSYVGVTVNQYAKATDAIAAFRQVERRLSQCVTTTGDSWTDPDTGVKSTWSSATTVGKVPLVTIVGVPSLFVNTNRTSTSSDETEGPQSNDTYMVFSLINDAIIVSSADSGSFADFTTKQKRAVHRVAFAATGAWVG